MKKFVHVLFKGYPPEGFLNSESNEDIVGIFSNKNKALEKEKKIICYGGCGGYEYTRIKKYIVY